MVGRFPRDVHQAFRDVVYEFEGGERQGGGVPALASKLAMSPGTLYNKANTSENESSHHKPTLRDAALVSLLSGDPRIAQAFCHLMDGVFVRFPDMSDLSTDALISHLLDIARESGDFHTAIEDALRADDKIHAFEFSRIERAAEEYVAAILECLHRMREMAGQS